MAPSSSAPLRAQFGYTNERAVLTFFGFVIPEHHVLELIEATSDVARAGCAVSLSVIGAFDPDRNSYHRRLREAAEEASREGVAITFHGRVMDPNAVARLIRVTDVAVLPYGDGVGENNGAFAAFAAAGVAVVTTVGPKSGAMEEEGVAEFGSFDRRALAMSIQRLLSDNQRREEIAERAAAYAQRHSWEAIARAYTQVFLGDETVELL